MIFENLKKFENKLVLLASGSPRRLEILSKFFNIKVVSSNYDEKEFPICDSLEYVKQLSLNKARYAIQDIKDFDLLIAADTIVELDGEILGKPETKENAINMINKLSGKKHLVHTSVTFIYKQPTGNYYEHNFVESTGVFMTHIDKADVFSYVNTLEPLDKAGGYAIQGIGSIFIKGIEGDYYNVMGFPLQKFIIELCQICNKSC